jgi:hypothetical protein
MTGFFVDFVLSDLYFITLEELSTVLGDAEISPQNSLQNNFDIDKIR